MCAPLEVTDGAATGAPTCEKAAADAVAQLSIKEPIAQRGAKASFTATASGHDADDHAQDGRPAS